MWSELALKTKQEAGSWVWLCVDGSTVPLSTRLKDSDVQRAVSEGRDARNIFKVLTKNRYYPLWHKLGEYDAYEGTSVLFS